MKQIFREFCIGNFYYNKDVAKVIYDFVKYSPESFLYKVYCDVSDINNHKNLYNEKVNVSKNMYNDLYFVVSDYIPEKLLYVSDDTFRSGCGNIYSFYGSKLNM